METYVCMCIELGGLPDKSVETYPEHIQGWSLMASPSSSSGMPNPESHCMPLFIFFQCL